MSLFLTLIQNYSFKKLKKYKAYLAILAILPVNFDICYVKGYQDDHKPKTDLIAEVRLNIDADKVATGCAKITINTYLPTSPFAIYIKDDCIHLPPHKII